MTPSGRRTIVLLLCCCLLPAAGASQRHTETALWVEMKRNGEPDITIALTRKIALRFADLYGEKKARNGFITKEMIQSVLAGREDSVRTHNRERDIDALLYLRELVVPEGNKEGKGQLVAEIHKSGRKDVRMYVPESELEKDTQSGEFARWKQFFPFLKKEGGVVYMYTPRHHTEVWLYID